MASRSAAQLLGTASSQQQPEERQLNYYVLTISDCKGLSYKYHALIEDTPRTAIQYYTHCNAWYRAAWHGSCRYSTCRRNVLVLRAPQFVRTSNVVHQDKIKINLKFSVLSFEAQRQHCHARTSACGSRQNLNARGHHKSAWLLEYPFD